MSTVAADTPPDCGLLEFSVDAVPVSRQADPERRRSLCETIRRITRQARYLLSGDVQAEVEWLVHEKERYESDSSPDVDNVLKPLMDALCGPDGLLIDDCQVQAVSCHWIDWPEFDHKLTFRFRFHPDEWVSKATLVFVHLGNNLCFPFNEDSDRESNRRALDLVQEMVRTKINLEKATGDYYLARRMLPVQRLFHRTRLREFRVLEAADFRTSLERAC